MNGKFIFILVLLVACGCKIKKEKSEMMRAEGQQQSNLQTNISWMDFNSVESSYRIWRFISDTSFYFHPDEGLWGQSGKIAYSERKRAETRVSKLKLDYDSVGIANSTVLLHTSMQLD